MKKTILITMALLLVLPFLLGLTSGYSVDRRPTGAWWSGSRKDTALRWAREIEDILEEDAVLFTPTTTVPTATRGRMYYDTDANGFKYYDGVSWINFDSAGAGSLDIAYDSGSSITVDSTTLTLTAPNANDKVPLTLIQSDTSTTKAFVITNAGTGNSIDIQGQSSAKDIEGTGDLWSVSTAGVGTYAGLITGGTDIVMENADTFANSTDDYFTFSSNDKEDFIIDLSQTDIVALTSSSSAVTLDTGTFATITGISTITGSAATDFTIQHTADTADEDLIISQAGSGAYSVIIQSAGTGTDSISIQATKGIDIDSVDDMTITNTASTSGDDLNIQQVGAYDSSLVLTSAGTGADAIGIACSAAGGGITMAAKGPFTWGALDAIDILLTASANTEDITIGVTGAFDASLLLASSGTGVDAIGLATSASTGVIKISSSDILDIDAVDNVNIDISGSGANLDIDSAAGSIYLDAGEAATNAIDIDSQGGMDIDLGGGSTYDFDVNTLASISFTALEAATDAINIDTQGGIDIDIGAGATYDFDVNTLSSIVFNTVEAATDAVNIDTQGGIDIDMGGGSTYDFDVNTLASINLTAKQAVADAFVFTSSGGFDLTAVDDIDITLTSATAGEDITIAVAGTLESSLLMSSIGTGVDAISLQVTGDDGDIDIDAGDNITIDANQINITAADAEGTSAIDIETNGDVTDTLRIYANQSTTAVSIQLLSDVGGITATASAGPILLNALGGSAGDYTATVGDEYILDVTGGLVMTSSEAADDAIELVADGTAGGIALTSLGDILLTTTGAAAEDIMLTNTGGSITLTATEAAVTDAIVLNASGDDGGVDIDAGGTAAIDANVITITASDSDAAGISNLTLETDGHASDVLKIFADQGTGATSIHLLSDVGGITQTASAGAFVFNATGATAGDWTATIGSEYILDVTGGVVLTSSEAADDAVELIADGTAGGITLTSLGDITLTTTGASTEDITLSNTGGSILLACTEDATDSIDIDTQGGIDVDMGGGAADDFDVNTLSSVSFVSKEAATNGIVLTASGDDGSIDINAGHGVTVDSNTFSLDGDEASNITVTPIAGGSKDLTISIEGASAADSSVLVASTGTGSDSISLQVTGDDGGIDIDAAHLIAMDANVFSIDSVELGNITVTAAADDNDLTIAQAGVYNSSLILSSTGTAADSIKIITVGGGIDIDIGSTTTAGEDFDVNTLTSINFATREAAADQFKIDAKGQATSGAAINLETTDGKILLNADGVDYGDIELNSADDMAVTAAGDFTLAVTGATVLPENVILKTTTAISDTEMDNLAATPIELVASPSGTDGTIEFISAIFALDWGGTAWTEPSAPDDLVIRYTNGSGAIVSQLLDATGFATATEDTIAFLTPTVSDAAGASVASVAITEAASTDQALVLHNTGSEWTASGDSQVVVIVYYRVHRTASLGL